MRLNVTVCGRPPSNLREPGDPAFERSRARALAAFEETKTEYSDPKRAADRLERIHELVTGHQLRVIAPSELFAIWKNARRKESGVSTGHSENVESTLAAFTTFLAREYPRLNDCRAVTAAIASAFMAAEERRGIAPKTYNNALIVMRAAMKAAGVEGGFSSNPFQSIPKKDPQIVHRRPYDPKQLEGILAAAAKDLIVGPVVITAICTGMRREDCVTLRWRVVDMEAGRIEMPAGKTGSPLFLPILRPLAKALERQVRRNEFCYPEAVSLFEKSPDSVNSRLKKILRAAGLRETEIRVDGPRLRRPSIEGFHRFKTTFVSVALNSGVPMAMLQKLVGNEVVQLVLDTYYQPGKEALTATIEAKFPSFLTGVVKERSGPVAGEGA